LPSTVGSKNGLGMHNQRKGNLFVKYIFDHCDICMFLFQLFEKYIFA